MALIPAGSGLGSGIGSSVNGGGGSGQLIADLGAHAFLRRTDAAAMTEGITVFFGAVAAGSVALARTPEAGNDWLVMSRERAPGLSAVVDGTTFTARAFLSSDLNQADFVARGYPAVITSARFGGTSLALLAAGEGTVVAGEVFFYYWEHPTAAGARAFRAISTTDEYLFNSEILWQGYVNNVYRGFLRENVKWLHDVTFDNNLTNEGRFADDAAALAYLIANKAYFQQVMTDIGVATLELAYFRTFDNTVRIGEVAFGVDGVAGEPTEPLVVNIHEDDQIIELRYASEATAGSPITRPDNIGEIVTAFNVHNNRGLHAQAAGGAADAAAFTRDAGFVLDPAGLVSTFIPRRNADDLEGIDVWLFPAGSDYLDVTSPIAAGVTLRVYSDADSVVTPPVVSFTAIGVVPTQFELHYNLANATIAQVVAAFNAHSAFGLHASVVDGTAAAAAFNRPQPWSRNFVLSNFAPDAWEVPFGNGERVTLTSAFYALGPEQNIFLGATEAAAETARNTYASTNPVWNATYQVDQRLFVVLRWGTGGQKATVLLEDGITWRDISYAFVGAKGMRGTPGGGALENLGIVLDGTGARAANEFIATGVMLGERGDSPYLGYRLNVSTLALLWFSTDELYDIERASAGDTSTDGSTGPPVVLRTRYTLPESAGSSISGTVHAGLTADGELLISTTTANVDITVEFFKYIPSVQQSANGDIENGEGLSDADRAKLDGIEPQATADQTGSEIKTAYEGQPDTNAFTNAEKTKLGTVESNAKDDQTGLEIKTSYEGESDTNAFTDAEKAALVVLGAANWVETVTATGSTITITRRDGTITQHTFPMGGMGGVSDGVLDADPVFDEDAQIVTFHISTGGTFTLNLADLVTQTELDAAINALANQTDAEVKASYERNANTEAFSSGEKTKLAGVFNGANRLIPYKLGNIYRAFAASANIVKPGNNEGTVNLLGVEVAPVGWQLTRPEATEALPHVYDCHVYGYETNGMFGIQYGTPNRTDRYIPPDVLKANLAGATFLGETGGITPVNDSDFTTKAYVDAAVAGTTPPSPQSEEIYFGTVTADDAAAAAAVALAGLTMQDATVAGHNITLGPSVAGQFFVILVPADHDLLTLTNTGTQANERGAYTRTTGRMIGDPPTAYIAYVLGPLNIGVVITYHLTLTE